VGEAFRNVVPRAVVPSYVVAFAYVAGDTADKARRAAVCGHPSSAVAWAATDVFLWQCLASVALPGNGYK
jgi:fission process protein 1